MKTLLSWSSGKDSAWTLYELQRDARCELAGLVTTINQAADRVAMHAVRTELLRAQARAAGLPLWEVPIPSPCSNAEYEAAMSAAMERAKLTCVDPKQVPDARAFAGRDFDARLLADLPASVDPCGERGEFHTFAYAGPMFHAPVPVRTGETVERDGFVFADLLPLPFPESLCHSCGAPPRYVTTDTSTFIMCPLLAKKYPPQPVRQCALFKPRS